MNNLITDTQEKDFFVWIDPEDLFVCHNIRVGGGWSSTPNQEETLLMVPNPKFEGFVSFFQNNIVRNYLAEYNLEMGRRTYAAQYPSRLQAIFLFETPEEAHKYWQTHLEHVGDRILKRVRSEGDYLFSRHDCTWVDYIRLPHAMNQTTIDSISRAYWSGHKTEDAQLESMGKPWKPRNSLSIFEVLFMGKIVFYDRSLEGSDV